MKSSDRDRNRDGDRVKESGLNVRPIEEGDFQEGGGDLSETTELVGTMLRERERDRE